VGWQVFGWFWDLTCGFWAENVKSKCKNNKQKQIVHLTLLRARSSDDKQKSEGKNKGDHQSLRTLDFAPGPWAER